jgi:hypothetical protein
MIEVYHRKQPTFELYNDINIAEHRQAWADGGYEKVATIETVPVCFKGQEREEEYAFYITNSIEHTWVENEGVTPIGGEHRSTSIGDVVKKHDGTLLICAPAGWQRLI